MHAAEGPKVLGKPHPHMTGDTMLFRLHSAGSMRALQRTSAQSPASDRGAMRDGPAAPPALPVAAGGLAAPEPLLNGDGRMRRTLPCRAVVRGKGFSARRKPVSP